MNTEARVLAALARSPEPLTLRGVWLAAGATGQFLPRAEVHECLRRLESERRAWRLDGCHWSAR